MDIMQIFTEVDFHTGPRRKSQRSTRWLPATLFKCPDIILLFDLDNLNMHSFEPAVHLSAFVHEALMPLLSYLGQERLPC